MGKLISSIGQKAGLIADPNAGAGAQNAASDALSRALAQAQGINVPGIEEQEIESLIPELVLSSQDERLDGSELEDISVDPRLRATQNEALEELRKRGETGLTEEDKARYANLRDQAGADDTARRATILQQMAERGMLDSGSALAAQLASNQAATQRQAQEGRQIASDAAAARREALAGAAQTARGMEETQYGQQAEKAKALDTIRAFNAGVSQRDTAAKQQQAQQTAQIKNQDQMYNKGLIQQNFQNQLNKATGVGGALGNQAQMAMQQAGMQAQAAQNQAAGIRGLVGTGAMLAMSDKTKKTNIKPANSTDIQDMLDELKPYEYDYKDESNGKGKQMGVMAQDLEKSKLGDKFVEDTDKGKMVNYGKMAGVIAASLSDINDRLKKIEGNKYADGGLASLEDQLSSGALLDESGDLDEGVVESGQTSQEGFDQARGQNLPSKNPQIGAGIDSILGSLDKTDQPMQVQPMQLKPFGFGNYADGGIDKHQKMGYEEGGSQTDGRIVPGNSFSGDDLSDKINSGEMVINLPQQDRLNSLIQELSRLRTDKKVDMGLMNVNEPQQQSLMEVIKGEKSPEQLPDNGIVEARGMKKLLSMLGTEK